MKFRISEGFACLILQDRELRRKDIYGVPSTLACPDPDYLPDAGHEDLYRGAVKKIPNFEHKNGALIRVVLGLNTFLHGSELVSKIIDKQSGLINTMKFPVYFR